MLFSLCCRKEEPKAQIQIRQIKQNHLAQLELEVFVNMQAGNVNKKTDFLYVTTQKPLTRS